MRDKLRSLLFGLLGKDPEAVVVSFWTGEDALARRMVEEVRSLVPDRRHFVVWSRVGQIPDLPERITPVILPPGPDLYLRLRRAFRDKRIGLAPVLFTDQPDPLRRAAVCLAPSRILAYNRHLERHHLRPSTAIASWLFLRGVPLDRIFLRPWSRNLVSTSCHIVDGRPYDAARRRLAVLSPYFPYPLSHGGAVRIYHLLRETAPEFDILLYAFARNPQQQEFEPLREFCSKILVAEPVEYKKPRWSTLRPPEAGEYDSPVMRRLLREQQYDLLQVEYTQLAPYGGDILVEHDVTWDLYAQVHRQRRTHSSWWDYFRWKLFETRAVRRFPQVIAMSAKDAALLGRGHIIPNGVDLERFRPEPERPGMRLLFVGSFNHFPNIEAFRFFAGQVWPALRARFPEMTLTAVAGRDHLLYWRRFTGLPAPDPPVLDFVRDVRPLYVEANLVIVPTTVSAGTNLKVLEAMAMERAVVSTPSGCAGLGLQHGHSVWIADTAAAFVDGVAKLAADPAERQRLARAARAIAERDFDWRAVGRKQRALLAGIPTSPRPPGRDG
ncbi:MAG: glycosyltransferase [Candidatus Solibacter usitatus]|nr:glycosyltransferase [Candidatus Solibacter usitatus]